MVDGLAVRLRTARQRTGLTQESLASKAGVDKGTVSRIEAGRRGASGRILQRLAQALDVSVDELLGEVPMRDGSSPEPAPMGEVFSLLATRFGALPPAGQRRVLRVIQAILE